MSESGMDNETHFANIKRFTEELVPFNRLLGIECVSIEDGKLKTRIPYRKDLIGDWTRPAIHGGVLSSFADATMGAAVFTKLSTEDACSTVDLRIDYLRPGLEKDIFCEAEVLRCGRAVAVVSAQLYQEPGSNIAVSKGVFMIRRGLKA